MHDFLFGLVTGLAVYAAALLVAAFIAATKYERREPE